MERQFDFIDLMRLEGFLLAKLQIDLKPKHGGIVTGCQGDLRYVREWCELDDYPDADGLIAVFEKLGGHCDCEVFLNVEAEKLFEGSEAPFLEKAPPELIQ